MQEYNRIMQTEISCHLNWIGNYFYGNGKYTVKGSPFSIENSDKEYKLNDWINACQSMAKPHTVLTALVVGVHLDFITPNIKGQVNGTIDNAFCGRSSYIQQVLDFVTTEMIKKKKLQS